jgi:hypothetical protein
MSVGPMGLIGSIAGTPLSQTKGSETEKGVDDTARQARSSQAQQQAEKASGIGQTEEDSEANDRDADGRRIWEDGRQESPDEPEDEEGAPPSQTPQSKDPTGMSGNTLDLSG